MKKWKWYAINISFNKIVPIAINIKTRPFFEIEKHVKAASNTATEAPTPASKNFGEPVAINS